MNRAEMIRFIKKERGYRNLNTQYGLLPLDRCKNHRLDEVCNTIKASNKKRDYESTLRKKRIAQVGVEKQSVFNF